MKGTENGRDKVEGTRFGRGLVWFGLGLLLGMAPGLGMAPAVAAGAAVATAVPLEESVPGRSDALLQFTSGGHVLGFGGKGVYVARGDHLLRVEFAGSAGTKPSAEGAGEPGRGAAPLTAVRYQDVWPGIDLRWEAEEGAVAESVWEIAPDADPGHIRLRYNAPVGIRPDGGLEVRFETGAMKESAPVAWQKIEGRREPVAVRFRLDGSRGGASVVGFEVGSYDPARPLWIDPVLEWNTFLGSSDNEYGKAIAVDSSGNVYVAGRSKDTWGSPKRDYSGGYDAFAAKLNADGSLAWNTFLGSSSYDSGEAIAVDGSGNVYVAGDSDFTWGSPKRALSGGPDAFAAKLGSDGALHWNTFLGSFSYDHGLAIAVDGAGKVCIAGNSSFTWGSPKRDYSGGYDAFAAKLDTDGALLWNTFLGSSGYDSGEAIAMDGSGGIYVAGDSWATWGSPKRNHSGVMDVFAAKLNAGGELAWNSFLGSSASDHGRAIAVDGLGNVYVAGGSWATWGSPERDYSGRDDAFAAKLSSDGALLWDTFLGSSGNDIGLGIAVDGSGNVYVAGDSDFTWGSPKRLHSGGDDAFAAKLGSGGALLWNTFLGSSDEDHGRTIAVNESGNVYITGRSDASWGSPVESHHGLADAFVVRLGEPSKPGGCTFFVIPTTNGKAAVICL